VNRALRPAAAALAALVALAALAVTGLTSWGLRAGRAEPLFVVGPAHGASYVPALRGRRPLFILVLGSDARPGQRIDRERADSIHLIAVNPRRRRATVVGFPRDSWVPIPGVGTGKINTALTYGGPPLMVQTVEALTGIRIDFWVLTSFGGLERMVDGVGGLRVDVPYPMQDRFSGSSLAPGLQRLDGREALAFARDRHSPPGGDFGRSENQGRLLVAALAELRRAFRRDPASLFAWIALGWRHLRSDLSVGTLLDLGLTATHIPPGRVRNLVVPGATGTAGGASVVFLSPAARSLFADLRPDGLVGR
jgi:LCP family protein required for cell wall assembly